MILNNMDTVKIEESIGDLSEVITLDNNTKYAVNGFVTPVGPYVFRLRDKQLRVYKCLDFNEIDNEGKTLVKEKFIKSKMLKISCSKLIEGPTRVD